MNEKLGKCVECGSVVPVSEGMEIQFHGFVCAVCLNPQDGDKDSRAMDTYTLGND